MDIQKYIDKQDFSSLSLVLDKTITKYKKGRVRANMAVGAAYYKQNNTAIMNRKKEYYTKSKMPQEDPYRANHKLPSGYMKLLVKQKVGYSVNEKMLIKVADDNTDTLKQIEKDLGNWRLKTKQLCTEASQKAVSFFQVGITPDNKFSYMAVPAEQIMPVANPYDRNVLEYVVKTYTVDALVDGELVDKVIVELWDSTHVYMFEEIEGKLTFRTPTEQMPNPAYHFRTLQKVNGKTTAAENRSWGRPPFIVLYNNDETETDLQPIKPYIDIYDITNSDFANNIDDFQDMYYILKNYNGQDLDEFFSDLKAYKAVPIGDDGDVITATQEVPTIARKTMLDLTEKLIYKFGMGVNPDDVEGNVTNVRIKALFTLLDLKANDFESEISSAFDMLLWFLDRYYELYIPAQLFDLESVELIFDRSLIMNEIEVLNAIAAQEGVVSKQTQLENHPWVINAIAEMKRIEDEAATLIIDDDEDDEEEEPPEETPDKEQE